MTKWYLKIWPIVLLVTLFLLVKLFIINPKQIDEDVTTKPEDIGQQQIDEEDLSIEKAVEESKEDVSIEGVNVPYYWKTGIQGTEKDYLQGYIPNINNFQEYKKLKTSLLLGISEEEKEEINLDSVVIDDSNYTFSRGITNSSDYFRWDLNSCSISYSNLLNSNVFLCYNWINWLGVPLEEKTFVLTKCSIDNTEGYCVFEDYLKQYFYSEKLGENRCIGNENKEYLCNYDDYIKLIEFN